MIRVGAPPQVANLELEALDPLPARHARREDDVETVAGAHRQVTEPEGDRRERSPTLSQAEAQVRAAGSKFSVVEVFRDLFNV